MLLKMMKKYKRLVAVVVILILVGLIEIFYNFSAITNGYRKLDLSNYINVEKYDGSERYVISYSAENAVFIKQIKLSGKFPKEYSYSVETTEINSFGKETEQTYTDTVNAWFTNFYTDLNKEVLSIEIVLDKPQGAKLTAVSCSNQVEINKYRILFFLVLFSMLYCIIFETSFCKKIEWYFAVYGTMFGLLVILFSQPVKVSWDDQIHFSNAYRLAYGKNVDWTEAAVQLQNWNSVKCNTKAEFSQLREYRDKKGREYAYTEEKETIIPSYSSLAYLPQAAFLRAGMIFKLPFSMLYAIGKVGNLLAYMIVMFFAIRLAKTKKLFLAFFAMMPTVLFQAASYTYDSVVISFITLGCVLWANSFFYPADKTSIWDMFCMVLSFIVGSLSKAVYIPVILLVLLTPKYQACGRKKKIMLWSGILLIFGIMMATFVLPTLINIISGNLSFGGDSRGGDTGAVGQLISMVKHPLASIKLMLQSVFQFDNFRNLGTDATDNYFFGNLMFLNFASLGILEDKWSALLVPAFVILLLYKDPDERGRHNYSIRSRFIMIALCLGTVFLVWLAMYLSFTPIGEDYIAGVQARYYLPLVYLGALLVSNRKIYVHCDKKLMMRCALSVPLILGFAGIYQCLLQGRFF